MHHLNQVRSTLNTLDRRHSSHRTKPMSLALMMALLCQAIPLAIAAPQIAQAATLNPGCTNGVGDASALISAISTANTNNQADTILLSTGCTYTLTAVHNNTFGPNGLPALLNDGPSHGLTIIGNGATIARSDTTDTPDFRLFYVSPNASLTLNEITLRNGRAVGFAGGNGSSENLGIASGGAGGGSAGVGGAIFNNNGTLNIFNSTLAGNQAVGGPGGNAVFGIVGAGGGGGVGGPGGNGGSSPDGATAGGGGGSLGAGGNGSDTSLDGGVGGLDGGGTFETGSFGIRLDGQTGYGGGDGGFIYWKAGSAFGTSQEAQVTLANVDMTTLRQGLLLKVQSLSFIDFSLGSIAVLYDGRTKPVHVEAFRTDNFAWTIYGNTTVSFADGDRLGARALANGEVWIYKNSTLVAKTTLTTADKAFFNARGGRIGVTYLIANRAVLDNFGGGTVPQ